MQWFVRGLGSSLDSYRKNYKKLIFFFCVKIWDVTVHPPYRNLVLEIKTLLGRLMKRQHYCWSSSYFWVVSLLVWPLHKPFPHGSESCSGCIQGSVTGVGYPKFSYWGDGYPRITPVDEHVAFEDETIVRLSRSSCLNILVHWIDTLPRTSIQSTKGRADSS